MLAFANCKINIGLHVTEKRQDGYHNLETVFYPVKWMDVVELVDVAGLQDGGEPRAGGRIGSSCIVRGVDVPGGAGDNIGLKAYRLMQRDFALPDQQIVLLKNIPVGAGLGGGSADAAFLIKLVNDKFGLGLADEKMEDYARQLGADCAFFIRNKPVYAFGKGDQFEPLGLDLSSFHIVLVKPRVAISTADAYANVRPKPAEYDLRQALLRPVAEWRNRIVNDFEASIAHKYPEIEKIKTELYRAGATFASMSGSGSAVYGIFEQPIRLEGLEKENQVFYNA